MNLTDLRDVLDERSTTDHAEARSHLVLSGVRRRLELRRRRRRMAAAVAAVLAVVAIPAGLLTIARSPERTDQVSGPKTINGFPEYAQGTRLFASATLAPGATSLVLPFVPGSTGLVIFVRCAEATSTKEFALKLNGHDVMSGSGCGSSFVPAAPDQIGALDVRAGERSVVEVTFSTTAPAGFAVGIGERVPVDQYVFPTRPATLTPLDVGGNLAETDDNGITYRTTFLLRPDPADPNRPVSRTFTWGSGGHLALRSQTPGALRVTMNGVEVASGEWWDYDQGLVDGSSSSYWPSATQRTRGATVTVTVTPRRMTGDWAVAFQEPSP
ncbi:hypothetical protein ACQP2F_16760 [Actinoplanes sp. CA-030573]|uniref:hypothetical protein n=1 Tax=Actinoplanes sp. CA-030573 TaxID=3239898 RepID=UPI003D90126C